MESTGRDNILTRTTSATSSNVSRRSSSNRLRPHRVRSNASLKDSTPATPTDDGSLTSFPSLSPRLDTSPEIFSSPVFNQPRLADAFPEVDSQAISHRAPSIVSAVLEDLISPTSAPSESSALFDDAPRGIRDVPGTLHHQSDEHVERLIGRMGAIALVKQLAQDLAERDAQMTLLQRRAEERETLLRKMLRECEVSNLDIENRLRELRKVNNGHGASGPLRTAKNVTGRGVNGMGTRPEASLSERLAEAFHDEHQQRNVRTYNHRQEAFEETEDDMATPRPPRNPPLRSGDAGYMRSGTSTVSRRSGTVQALKDYLRFTSGSAREGFESAQLDNGQLRNGLLQGPLLDIIPSTEPLQPSLSRNSSHASLRDDVSNVYRDRFSSFDGSESASTNRSTAGWITKLVAGGTKSGSKATRDRAATFSTYDVNGRKITNGPVLQRAKSRNNMQDAPANRPPSGHSAVSALSHSRTVRRIPDASRPSIVNIIPPGTSDNNTDSTANFGLVEMDTILPEETRPPTLTQYHNYGSSAEFLTDRFGFIYDQRRRRRQHEAAAALPGKMRAELPDSMRNGTNATNASNRSGRNRSGSLQGVSRPDTPASMDDQSTDQPAKRWQDYLKLTNFRTELLSHTPSAAPITEVTTAESLPSAIVNKAPSQFVVSKNGSVSLPGQHANPPPSPTRIVSENAELATPAATPVQTQSARLNHESPLSVIDPVRALLNQVNDVHDALQREKTTRWNEFLRKVRTERHRERDFTSTLSGRTATIVTKAMPETLLADGEFIGVAGLGIQGKVGRAKGSEFRNLVLNGIPVAYRAKIWAECCGASTMRVPGYYEELVRGASDSEGGVKFDQDETAIAQQIQMDITRTLTDNIFFRKGQGVAKLEQVLRAYARRNPVVGYCQGMNLITANLLLIMPAAEDAFWILTSIIENILPEKYYDSSLLASRADQAVLREYVSAVLPTLGSHFEELGIDLEAVTFQWFLSLFTDCLSAEALFRVWDVVLCLNDGATFLFQLALALLSLNEKALLACESPAEVYGYINQKMTDHAISIDGLIRASEGLKREVKREDVVERREKVIKREEELVRERERIRKGKGRAGSGGGGSVKSDSMLDRKITQQLTSDPVTNTPTSSRETGEHSNPLGLTLEFNDTSAAGPSSYPTSLADTDPVPDAQDQTHLFPEASSSHNTITSTPLTTPPATPNPATSSTPRMRSTSSKTKSKSKSKARPSRLLSRKTSLASLFDHEGPTSSSRSSFDSGMSGQPPQTSTVIYAAEDADGEWAGDLRVRTPMPIDEEVLWRG